MGPADDRESRQWSGSMTPRRVSSIYASALTPENWIVAMADVRRTLDAQSAGLLLADGAGRSIKSASLPPMRKTPTASTTARSTTRWRPSKKVHSV